MPCGHDEGRSMGWQERAALPVRLCEPGKRKKAAAPSSHSAAAAHAASHARAAQAVVAGAIVGPRSDYIHVENQIVQRAIAYEVSFFILTHGCAAN